MVTSISILDLAYDIDIPLLISAIINRVIGAEELVISIDFFWACNLTFALN